MSLFKDFKAFALKGNVMDLAIAVIIGGAFGKIVTSLVSDLFMPVLGAITGNVNFKELSWIVFEGTNGKPPVVIQYGNFLQNVVDFIIIAFFIFMIIRALSKLDRKKTEETVPTEPKISNEEKLLTEIRDLLKHQKND